MIFFVQPKIFVSAQNDCFFSPKMIFVSEQKEFDKVFNSQGMNIFCDLKSYLYLKGIEIDFSSDMLNGGFKIVNPNAERTCGCGTSFSV